MDNLGAIVGPLLALLLVVLVGTRAAMLLSVVPGLFAARRHSLRDSPDPAAEGEGAAPAPPT
jgi:hypothetical protein